MLSRVLQLETETWHETYSLLKACSCQVPFCCSFTDKVIQIWFHQIVSSNQRHHLWLNHADFIFFKLSHETLIWNEYHYNYIHLILAPCTCLYPEDSSNKTNPSSLVHWSSRFIHFSGRESRSLQGGQEKRIQRVEGALHDLWQINTLL